MQDALGTNTRLSFSNWKRLMRYLSAYRMWVGAAVIGAIIGNLLAVIIPMIIGQVIDIGVQRNDARFMLYAGLGMVALGLIRGVAGFLARYYGEKLSHYVAFDIRDELYDKVQHLSFTYHDNSHVGTIVTRAISDVNEIQRYFAFGLLDSINVFLLLVGSLGIMLYTNPVLTFAAFLPLIPLIYFSRRFAMSADPQWKKIMEQTQKLSNHIQENAIGAQVVRVFAREKYEKEKFFREDERLYHDFINLISMWAGFLPLSAFIASLSTAGVLLAGGWLEQRGMGGVTAGTVVAFNAYVLQLANPLRFLGFVILLTTQGLSSSARVFEILDEPIDIESKANAIKPDVIKGEVTFDNVTFWYKGETKPALRNISFTAQAGQVIGIVGPTGSGKSSLVNLIPRFYDVTEGRVLIDGIDVRDLDLHKLRSSVGMVMQTTLLFSASVHDNIAYGRTNATHKQVEAAAIAANAHDFILGFDRGYNTMVGERGVTLSGGQRQRVAIARALLINPRILILDDSTSSVDTRTERLIQEALQHLMNGRTTFIIAQRLTSVMNADEILVVEGGEIVERGRHDDLIQKGGVYAGIYQLQMQDQDRIRTEEAFEGVLKLTPHEEKRATQEFRRLAETLGGD